MNYSIKYIIGLLIFLIISCGKSEEINESDNNTEITNKSDLIIVSKAQFVSENMKLVNVGDHSFPTHVKTTGIIDVPPNSKAVISAYAGGYIKNSPLLIGDKVTKGQALLTIENLDFIQMQQEYLEISEQLTYLRSEYERQKELFDEKISSKKSFLKAESDFKKANAMYSGLYKKLQMLNIDPTSVSSGNLTSVSTIYSPISGSISGVNVSTGTYVSPADKIMEIINTNHIHLELKVFEKDILKLKEGQKVIFRIPESSGENYEGDIHLIGKSIDENRTVQVHAHIDHNIKYNFIVGMFVETDIVVKDNISKALPEDAIVEIDNKNYALILKSKDKDKYTFTIEQLTLGKTFDGFTEIRDSLPIKSTDQFLLGGFNIISERE
jgi:cobalt-zinc-cadmium efflux system membrane fusion protein